MRNFTTRIQNKANALALRARMALSNQRGDFYISDAVKIIIAVVLGAFMLFRLIRYCCLFHLRRCRQFRHCQKCRFLQFSSPSFFQAPLHTKFLVGAFSRQSPPPRSAGCRR